MLATTDAPHSTMRLLCCQIVAARGCCCGTVSLRTGVRLVACSLLLVALLSLVESFVLIEKEEHGTDVNERHAFGATFSNNTCSDACRREFEKCVDYWRAQGEPERCAGELKEGNGPPGMVRECVHGCSLGHSERDFPRAHDEDEEDEHEDEHEDDEDEHEEDEEEDPGEMLLEVLAVIAVLLSFCVCALGCRAASTHENNSSQLQSAEVFCWGVLCVAVIHALKMCATAVWLIIHEPSELIGFACWEMLWTAWYVYGLYISLSYLKALHSNTPCMNGSVVALESIEVHTNQARPTVQVLATPVQGFAQGMPSKAFSKGCISSVTGQKEAGSISPWAVERQGVASHGRTVRPHRMR